MTDQRKNNQQHAHGTGAQIWLISFGDFVTLLVCIFVFLLAGNRGRALAGNGSDYEVTLFAQDLNQTQDSVSENGAKKLETLRISPKSEIRMQVCDGNFTAFQVSRVMAVERQISGRSQVSDSIRGEVTFNTKACEETPGALLKVQVVKAPVS